MITKQTGIITFDAFLGSIATQSTTTARNGELFLLHFELKSAIRGRALSVR